MADANVVAAKMTVDITNFKTGMAELTASAKASLDQIVSQLTNLSSSSASSTSQIVQNLKNLTSSSNSTGAAIRQMGQQSTAAIQQMSTQYQASMAQINTAMSGIAQSNNALMTSLNLNIQRTREELTQAISAISATTPALASAAAAQRGHANAVGVNSTAMREFLVIIREASRGDVTRLGGSLSILAQQFDFTSKIIQSLMGPMGAIAVAIGLVAYESYQADSAQRKLINTLELSGNAAGFTASSFNKMALQISTNLKTSVGSVTAAMLELTRRGVLTKESIQSLTEAAILYGRKSGESLEDSLKHFQSLQDGATKAAQQIINEGLIPLTAKEYDNIRVLDLSGERHKAMALLIDTVKSKLVEMKDTTSGASSSWNTFTSEISRSITELGKWVSNSYSVEERIAALQKKISIKASLGFDVSGDQKDLEGEKKKKGQEDADAKEKQNQSVVRQNHLENINFLDSLGRKNTDLYNLKLANLYKTAKEENLSAKEVAEYKAELDRRFKPIAPKKEKGAVTQSQIVRGELLDYLNAHEQAAIDMHKIYTKRLQDTLDFYTQEASIIRGRKGATAADVKRVDNQVKVAKLAMDKEAQVASITAMQDEIKDRSKGYDEQIRLAKAFEAKLFDATAKPDNAKKGEFNQSKQYYDAQKERKTLQERGLQESLQIQQEEYKGFATIELEKLDDLKASYKIQLTEHQINLKAYLALMRQEASDELKIKEKLIDDEIALERQKDGGGDLVKIKALENQKLLIERQSNKELAKNSQDAAGDYMKRWDDAWKHMTDSFSSNIEKVIKKQQNLGQAFRYTLGDMVLYGAKESEKIAINWIKDRMHELIFGKAIETQKTMATGIQTQARIGIQAAGTAQGVGLKVSELPVHFGIEQAKTGATVIGEEERVVAQEAGAAEGLAIKAAMAIKQIAIDAYTAFAGAYAAIAAIPYVGPVLAPIAAGVAFAGVIAAGRAIASAEGGYDIPHGVNPVTQLHQDEMVLPAPVANTVRSAMNGSTNAAKRDGGNTHIHMNIHTPNADSFRKSATQIQRETKRKMATVG